jgi:hypothetical protein
MRFLGQKWLKMRMDIALHIYAQRFRADHSRVR